MTRHLLLVSTTVCGFDCCLFSSSALRQMGYVTTLAERMRLITYDRSIPQSSSGVYTSESYQSKGMQVTHTTQFQVAKEMNAVIKTTIASHMHDIAIM